MIASSNLARAGVADRVEIMVGPALESLQRLKDEGGAKFDPVFIDADKPNNPHYLRAALDPARPDALIIADNVVRDGAVIDPASSDDRVQGVRAFTDLLAMTDGLLSTAIQTVDQKGWNGMRVSIVEG